MKSAGLGKLYCVARFKRGRRFPPVYLGLVYIVALIYNLSNNKKIKLFYAPTQRIMVFPVLQSFRKSVFTKACMSHKLSTRARPSKRTRNWILRWHNTYTSIAYVVFIASHRKLPFERGVHSHRSATTVCISVSVTNSAWAKRKVHHDQTKS